MGDDWPWWISAVQPLVSGCAGGLGCTVVGHPFETVKARLQAGIRPTWPGVRAAYAGIGSPIAGQVPFWGSLYCGYSVGTQLKWDSSLWAQAFAGAVAGTFRRVGRHLP